MFWRWKNQASEQEERVLELYGTIAEESWFDDDVTPQMFRNELFSGKGPITLWINSPGGDCIAASQIYTMLMDYPDEVTVKIDGIAASAASVIAMAGTKVLMAPTALMMIHNPATITMGDHEDMKRAIEMLDEVKESIINAYEIKTGVSRIKLSHLMDAETWMNANKAIELGFADDVLKDEKQSEPTFSAYAFSRKAVATNLLNKMAEKNKPIQAEESAKPQGRSIDELKERLLIIKNICKWRNFTMTITEMRNKRKKLIETMDGFLDTHKTKNGTLSAEDDATYKTMEDEITELTNEIHRMERREAIEAELEKPVSKPIIENPMNGRLDNSEIKTGRAADSYKTAMLSALRSNFRNVSNVLQEGVDADGGYLVPEEYDSRLIDGLEEENIIRKLGHRITTSGERKINIAATKPAAAWIDEGEALTFSDATFSQINLDAHKLHVAVKVTEELLYDNAFQLENYIIKEFYKALANAEEDAFINGNGTGKPLGILAASGGAEVGVTTASATAITADEVINLVYSLKRPYRKNAVFILNDQTIAALRKLKDGNGAYMWQAALVAGEPDKLLGYPVYTSAYMPTIEAGAKTIIFGDLSYYNIGDRGSRSFAELRELFAGNGMVGFVAKERVDGKLVLPEAIKVLQQKA